ncbi:unnamed protein product [Acanthoscelides obtectus]|uniref:Uncharacterized protein n=1 Tax=Acanthoscelides obtectus TaxID=200917 RepID=A0A9P0L781_ACAOB|nr:unnamed protein product [Acanthoscelides obtectus]CAK1638989.1 hypothetical protein AOBTE_LOCUS10922 [Acanthoscelides obtectus]
MLSLQFVWTSSPHRNRKRFDCSKCPEVSYGCSLSTDENQSSAYDRNLQLMTSAMLSINIMKGPGPNDNPCGTPDIALSF